MNITKQLLILSKYPKSLPKVLKSFMPAYYKDPGKLCSGLYLKRLAAERGVSMIQTAITLPLFLFIVFFIIFISVTYNAKSGLVEATRHGARLALSRGDQNVGGVGGIIPLLDSYSASGGVLPPALNNSGLPNAELDYDDWKVFLSPSSSSPPFYDNANNLNQLRDYYAIAYVYRTMREVVGEGILYPCDCPDNSDCSNGAQLNGCVTCVNPFDATSPDQGIKCVYRPSSAVLNPVLALLRLISSGGAANIEVESEFYYPDTLNVAP